MEIIVLICQIACVFFLAAWLTTGVLENLLRPSLNETFTAEVLELKRMQTEYPEAYAEVAHRAIKDRHIQKLLFRFIVAWETFATILLWLGFLALLGALFDWLSIETANIFALSGVMAFTATWSGFLVAGNYFCYWFSHEGAQNTHFQMTLWGMSVMIFLALG